MKQSSEGPALLVDRFWKKVRKGEGREDCWEWTAARIKSSRTGELGYGAITVGSKRDKTKRTEYAHRLSWIINYGEISDGLSVLHQCDNPACVRPDHLFLGTTKDNAVDMANKDRWRNQYKDNPPTHCKRGHEFTEANTRTGGKGERVCRACAALWARENRKKNR